MAFNSFYIKFTLFAAMYLCSYIGFSQRTIDEWRAELEMTNSAEKKADACFFISLIQSSRLKIDSSLFYARKIKEYSEQANYQSGMGKYYLAMSSALRFRKKNKEAKENALMALLILGRQKDKSPYGMACGQMALVQQSQGNNDSAHMYYWNAIHYLDSPENSYFIFTPYFELARNYYNVSGFDSAAYYFLKALEIAEKINNSIRIFNTAIALGQSFLRLRDLQNAYKYLDYGNKFATSADPVSYWLSLKDYANCLILVHDFPKADSVIKDFEKTANKVKQVWGYIMVNKLKGIDEYEKQNYNDALNYLQAAYKKIDEIPDYNADIQDIAFALGKTEYERGNYDSAIIHLRSASTISHLIGYMLDETEADLLLSEAYEKNHQPDSALHYFNHYSLLKDSVLSLQKQKTIIEVTTRYETEKKEQEIKILEKEKEANSYLLQLKNQQIEKQKLMDEKKSQQLALMSQQNEINKLDAAQKSLSLENVNKENVQRQSELKLFEQEAAYQKLLLAKQDQQRRIIYIGIVVLLVLTSYGLYRYMRKKRSENRQQVLNERLRISRELHDEVGATLSGVALFSEIAKERMDQQREDDARLYLNHISANSKEMVEKMSDIVWSINPDNDSFERIITKLRSYAFNLCAGKGISLHPDIDDTLRNDSPSMEVKRNLYLFMKEAINNAIKYSGGRNIFLSLKKKGDSITAEIRDDGIGFDAQLNHPGNGLKNMKARADSVGGKFIMESEKGRGTLVSLRFRFHPAGGQSQAV